MRRWVVVLLLCLGMSTSCSSVKKSEKSDKTVFLAILARNKAHYLPTFLQSIENFTYDKKKITIYINTNNNVDDTAEILHTWASKQKQNYRSILFEEHEISTLEESPPHVWSANRLRTIGAIRNHSLEVAKEEGCDFYFVIDVDNYLDPDTLGCLVKKDLPIVAPMLHSIPERDDCGSTFFYAIHDWGGFKDHPNYWKILRRELVGTIQVPLVHATYLIKSEYLDRLSYADGTDQMEFLIFAKSARDHGVDQYVCNEKIFGVQFSFHNRFMDLEDEKRVTRNYLLIP